MEVVFLPCSMKPEGKELMFVLIIKLIEAPNATCKSKYSLASVVSKLPDLMEQLNNPEEKQVVEPVMWERGASNLLLASVSLNIFTVNPLITCIYLLASKQPLKKTTL